MFLGGKKKSLLIEMDSENIWGTNEIASNKPFYSLWLNFIRRFGSHKNTLNILVLKYYFTMHP